MNTGAAGLTIAAGNFPEHSLNIAHTKQSALEISANAKGKKNENIIHIDYGFGMFWQCSPSACTILYSQRQALCTLLA